MDALRKDGSLKKHSYGLKGQGQVSVLGRGIDEQLKTYALPTLKKGYSHGHICCKARRQCRFHCQVF